MGSSPYLQVVYRLDDWIIIGFFLLLKKLDCFVWLEKPTKRCFFVWAFAMLSNR